MMYEEFERIAGYEVSYEDYINIIEPMYTALPNVNKHDFVKMIDKKRFALPTKKQMLKEMKKIAQHLAETCEYRTDYEARDQLDKIAKAYAKRFHGIDWSGDTSTHVYFLNEYAYPEIQRGCTYPCTLIIGRDSKGNFRECERIELV